MVTRALHWIGKALGSAVTFIVYIVPFVLAFIASTAWRGLRDGWSRQWLS